MLAKKQALGRGLNALIPGNVHNKISSNKEIRDVDIDKILPNPYQPRTHFNEESIEELSESIKEKGVVQPLIVCENNDEFILVAGERRLRASKKAGLTKVPVIIANYNKSEMLQIALIENIQREGLNPLEEALSYRRLISEFNCTQEDVAKFVGKNRSSVANSLRLLNLPKDIQNDIEGEKITAGHARAILSLDSKILQEKLRNKIVEKNLSVRQAEQLASDMKHPIEKMLKKKLTTSDSIVLNIQNQLIEKLCTKVKVKTKSDKQGKIEIYYNNYDDLDKLFELLGIDTN